MNHVAIDLGSRESQICVRGPDGLILEEKRYPTRKLSEVIRGWSQSRVVLETSAEAFRIADAAKAAGHEVRIVPATMVRLLGVGERGVKNDRKDAQQLSEASWRTDLPSVHIPSAKSREIKSLCGSRDLLVATQRNLANNVRGWVRTQLWKVPAGEMRTLPARLRAHAASLTVELPEHIERQLTTLELVTEQVKAANKQIERLAKSDPDCQRLMTVPGIGPVTSLRFVAAIDDPSRFSSSHRVQSYVGLTPGERSSGSKTRTTAITKAGQTPLRWCLVQAAWSAMNSRGHHPMLSWAQRIADRRGKAIAAIALARKLTGILFALWRDKTTYQATRAAQEILTPT